MDKKKIGYLGVVLVFLMLFSELTSFNQKELNLETQTEFSDKLQHESYTPLEQLDKWYDGIETFLYDSHGTNPMRWGIENENGYLDISVQGEIGSHKNVLSIYDNHNSQLVTAKFYFPKTIKTGEFQDIVINNFEFWIRSSNFGAATYYQFVNSGGTTEFTLYVSANYLKFYTSTVSSSPTMKYVNNNQWYHIRAEVWVSEIGMTLYSRYLIYVDKIHVETITDNDVGITDIEMFKVNSHPSNYGYTSYIDAICVKPHFNSDRMETEILNAFPDIYHNYKVFTTDDYFSFFETIIDRYPNYENNFRTWFITDNIMNTKYIDDDRLLRLRGTDSTQNKYKIIQLYFDDLDNNDSFLQNKSQFVDLRVDTFDSSENLINMFHFNLTFNQSHGMIYWNALYRESLAIPIWHEQPTNPIFNFSDYLEEGEVLKTLQVNCHFMLTYNGSHKLILIRTQVQFNNRYDKIYEYDKIISAGDGTFYNTQSKIKVAYIDYFNYNNGSDYLGNRFYTYNNLRGIRTLETNSTDYFFNFLDAGFFNTELDYYVKPEPREPDPQPEPPDEPEPPDDDLDYWTYESFSIRKDGYNTIELSETVEFYNESVDIELSNEFDLIEGYSYTAKFYYDDNLLSNSDLGGDWKPSFDIGLGDFEINLNWMRDIVRTIVNTGWLIIQWFIWLGTVALNYLIMFLIVALIFPFVWNYPIFWIYMLGINVGFYFYVLMVFLIGWLWWFLIWIFEYIIIPIVEWFIEDALPMLIEFIIVLIALIIALMLWAATLGQEDYDVIYYMVYTNLNTLIDEFIELMLVFIDNIEFFMLFLVMYIINIGLIFVKYLNAKAHGHVIRAERCLVALEVFVFPIIFAYELMIKLKSLIHPTAS